jgi:pSer/pThr/pTyr-binding forkhead associated (FHA) protein
LPIVVIREKNQADRCFRTSDHEVLIGRSPKCDLVLANVSVSRHHVSFAEGQNGWEIQDLRSGNGTSLNGEPVKHAAIKSGDVIGIGKFTLCFYETEEAALLAGIDVEELALHHTSPSAAQNTATFQIPRGVLEKMRATEALVLGAQVVQEGPPGKSWRPGEEPLAFGAKGGPPVKRLLGVGTAAIVHWNGSQHVVKRTSRITGVWVNGEEIAERQSLNHGDTLEIGGSSFRYLVDG